MSPEQNREKVRKWYQKNKKNVVPTPQKRVQQGILSKKNY